MLYISGIHALNLTCSLETCGDWHQSGICWDRLNLYDSDKSIFGEYGIEKDKYIPFLNETYNVANHIRALLDLLEQGHFTVAGGMRDDFICNDKYNEEIFYKVLLLKNKSHWEKVDAFMKKEYKSDWLEFKKRAGI